MPPLLTAVVPTYNVSEYLPAFLDGLAAQTTSLDDVDLIFVNDGSTDDSAGIIESWIAESGSAARVVHQDNAGLSAARNCGIDNARGAWITFPDPDDVLDPAYLDHVLTWIQRDGDRLSLIATKLMYLDDATGELRDNHPLSHRFANGDTVVNLARHPHQIHLSGATAIYRLDRIRELGLRFDSEIRPGFEDASFTTLYLSEDREPIIANVASAVYRYRRRADKSSTTQTSWHSPEKYGHLLRVGHLPLLKTLHERHGHVPTWAQNVVLYDLNFYFREDARAHSVTAWIPTDLAEEFRGLVIEILKYIDEATIWDFNVSRSTDDIKRALVYGGKRRATPLVATLACVDLDQKLMELRYPTATENPEESFRSRGYAIEPVAAKTRSMRLLNSTWYYERIVWLPSDGLTTATVGGEPLEFRRQSLPPPHYRILPSELRSIHASRTRSSYPQGVRSTVRRARRLLAQLVQTVPMVRDSLARRKYRNAWILVDRDTEAHDNAEHLYRHLKETRPDINAWFALKKSSSDWGRLASEGFRLLDYGSREHRLALQSCINLVSSQVDHYIVHPLDTKIHGPERWKFTFLQHGVTKDDLSRWLNPKPISLLITATGPEKESIVGNGTPYRFTDRETRLTGFPRHDRLGRVADSVPSSERRLVLVVPTWRRYLLGDQLAGGNLRSLNDDFWDSDYVLNWFGLLKSTDVAAALERAGLELAFLPHPNLQPYLDEGSIPSNSRVYRYDNHDVQDLIARSAVVITDYSSLAFEAAYARRPVLYFQFDEDQFFSGGHAYRKGYWDYRSDGFGPVETTLDGAIAQLVRFAADGNFGDEQYASRAEDAFPQRDGKAGERVISAIEDLHRAAPAGQRHRRMS